MTYRDILVQIDETAEAGARAAVAATLARRWDARLTGVFLKSDLLRNPFAGEAMAYMPPSDIETLLREQAEAVNQAAEAGHAAFLRAAAAKTVEPEWRVIDGDSNNALIACARRSDLTILPAVARASLDDRASPPPRSAWPAGAPSWCCPTAPRTLPSGCGS